VKTPTSSNADPAVFYDDLAELYHLVYQDWSASVERQGEALSAIIRERWNPARRLLDAACGIGTQALGLGARGFDVVASDISPASLERARREAASRGLAIEFVEADLRSLTSVHEPAFDVVLACDNAVPHLMTKQEILRCFTEMRSLLRPGGGCLISVRDYAAIERSGTRMVPYGVRATPRGRVAVFQVWDFLDQNHYDVSLYFVGDLDAASPWTRVFRTRYHAIVLPELEELLRQTGFQSVDRVLDRFFQPVLVATNPE
jgi:SAM-dependent methyltransferase